MIEEFLQEQDRPLWLELEYADEINSASTGENALANNADEDQVLEFYQSTIPGVAGRSGFSSPPPLLRAPTTSAIVHNS